MGNVVEILDQGFACLVDHLGVIEAEYFISSFLLLTYTVAYSFINFSIAIIFCIDLLLLFSKSRTYDVTSSISPALIMTP